MREPLTFDYIRTDGIYRFTKQLDTGIFDVVIMEDNENRSNKKIYLLRHDKQNVIRCDKQLIIPLTSLSTTGIISHKPYDDSFPAAYNGTYTFPDTPTNRARYVEIDNFNRSIT